jgi:hypothetical protein
MHVALEYGLANLGFDHNNPLNISVLLRSASQRFNAAAQLGLGTSDSSGGSLNS